MRQRPGVKAALEPHLEWVAAGPNETSGLSALKRNEMTRQWFWSLLLALLLTAALQGQSRESLLRAVAENPSWSPAGKPNQYTQKNIEELAGNRASAINHYGLIGATTQSWRGPQGIVRLTLYEMIDASAGY